MAGGVLITERILLPRAHSAELIAVAISIRHAKYERNVLRKIAAGFGR
jgi:hypothetical protein